MSENKELNEEKLEKVNGGGNWENFYSPDSVRFLYSVGDIVKMDRGDVIITSTITDRGVYKKDYQSYYACYYIDLDNYTGDGWFYYDSTDGGVKFSHRIGEPLKKGL